MDRYSLFAAQAQSLAKVTAEQQNLHFARASLRFLIVQTNVRSAHTNDGMELRDTRNFMATDIGFAGEATLPRVKLAAFQPNAAYICTL